MRGSITHLASRAFATLRFVRDGSVLWEYTPVPGRCTNKPLFTLKLFTSPELTST